MSIANKPVGATHIIDGVYLKIDGNGKVYMFTGFQWIESGWRPERLTDDFRIQ